MFIVYGHAELFFPYCASLKEKRKYIQSIVARIRKRFNISIAEVAYQDLWQRSILGFSAVCGSQAEADLILQVIRDNLDRHEDAYELLHFQHRNFRCPLE
ncbi:MAG: DUF503 domain-containing protein [Syntrophomonadaceae bacterium]|nr:DUF503 domain-containing protein [Syntrophomonadaceae bacterium]